MRAAYFEVSIPRVLATQLVGALWKGAYFAPGAPFTIGEVEPKLERPTWIEVRNRVCGICASDLQLVYLRVDPRVHSAALPRPERIYLGHEVVGRVARTGPEVSGLREGDRVLMKSRFMGPNCHSQQIEPPCRYCAQGDYCLCRNRTRGLAPPGVGGGWAEGYTCHQSEVYVLPDELDDEQAVLIEPLSCGVRAVLRQRPQRGDKALVIGCGTMGLGTVAALGALAPGAQVFAVARHPHQRAAAERLGAEVLDGDLFEQAARVTSAELCRGPFGNRTLLGGFEVVYDCVASAMTLGTALRVSRSGGSVVMVGVDLTRLTLDLSPVLLEEVRLLGSLAHGAERYEGERLSTFALTVRLLREGRLATDGLITHRFALADLRAAIRCATDKTTGSIKVVLDCTGPA